MAFLNTVDVHALSHVLDIDEHKAIEQCDTCEEFVFTTHNQLSTAQIIFKSELCFNFTYVEKLKLPTCVCNYFLQEKHLGKYFNKPPPHTF